MITIMQKLNKFIIVMIGILTEHSGLTDQDFSIENHSNNATQ